MIHLKKFNESHDVLYTEIHFDDWSDKGDIYVDIPKSYSDKIRAYCDENDWTFEHDEYGNILINDELSITLDHDEYFYITDRAYGRIYTCDQLEGLFSCFEQMF